MTYEEKREWLQRYKVARQLFSFRLQQLETARTDERIREAEERAAAQAGICDEIREEITAALDTLDNLCDRDILYRKYIGCQSWSMIMQGTCLSKSAVLAHHRQAIENLQLKSQD